MYRATTSPHHRHGSFPGAYAASTSGMPKRSWICCRDRVIVTDALNSRIQVFTPKGEHLLSFGEFGTTEGTLFRPAGLAIFAGDRILVGDNYFGSIQLFAARGGYLGVLCGPKGLPLALENPVSLAARGGMVYVLETGAGRLSIYRIEGR